MGVSFVKKHPQNDQDKTHVLQILLWMDEIRFAPLGSHEKETIRLCLHLRWGNENRSVWASETRREMFALRNHPL